MGNPKCRDEVAAFVFLRTPSRNRRSNLLDLAVIPALTDRKPRSYSLPN